MSKLSHTAVVTAKAYLKVTIHLSTSPTAVHIYCIVSLVSDLSPRLILVNVHHNIISSPCPAFLCQHKELIALHVLSALNKKHPQSNSSSQSRSTKTPVIFHPLSVWVDPATSFSKVVRPSITFSFIVLKTCQLWHPPMIYTNLKYKSTADLSQHFWNDLKKMLNFHHFLDLFHMWRVKLFWIKPRFIKPQKCSVFKAFFKWYNTLGSLFKKNSKFPFQMEYYICMCEEPFKDLKNSITMQRSHTNVRVPPRTFILCEVLCKRFFTPVPFTKNDDLKQRSPPFFAP